MQKELFSPVGYAGGGEGRDVWSQGLGLSPEDTDPPRSLRKEAVSRIPAVEELAFSGAGPLVANSQDWAPASSLPWKEHS